MNSIYSLKLVIISFFFSLSLFSCAKKESISERPVYCIFENVVISDEEKMEIYKSNVTSIVSKYGGEYIAASENLEYVEGIWKPDFLIIIKFPSMKKTKEWYNSEDYKPLKELRISSGNFNAVFIEGF